MKNISLVFFSLIFCVMCSGLQGQTLTGNQAGHAFPGASMVRQAAGSVLPTYVSFIQGKELPPEKLLPMLAAGLGNPDELDFKLVNEERDELGFRHKRYQLRLSGHPVHGAILVLHLQNGLVHSFNGRFPGLPDPSGALSLSEEMARELAITSVGADRYKWEMPEEEALIKETRKDPKASYFPAGELHFFPLDYPSLTQYRLCWRFEIYADEPLSKQEIFVDAETGVILHSFNKIHVVDVTATAITKYSGTQEIKTTAISGGFRLRETERGGGIETYDMNEGTNYGAALDFTDADNLWDNVNAQFDEVATDAHWGSEMTYDYYKERYNRNSIDNAGFPLRSYVHYDVAYANAFWDGERMTYGDGDGNMDPLTALDITAHEITHGLTSFTANLDYAYESGALNEAFSDIFGASIEFFAKPTDANWTIGEDIGSIIRVMSNPNLEGQPDTYLGSLWFYGADDNGGVHYNSGVMNYWYFLVSEGGAGTNDLGHPFSVPAIGINKAGAIAYRTLVHYLTNTAQYEDARFYSILAAADLFGACSPEVESVTRAWYAVGIGPNYVDEVLSDFEAPIHVFCGIPAVVQFENLSLNGSSFSWSFGDGATSSQISPSHTYTGYGEYSVSLMVNGGTCGMDTLVQTAYVSILPTNPCNVFMVPNGVSNTQTGCSGTLFDSGGTSNYQDNSNSVITIAPLGALSLIIEFSLFDFEEDYDFLTIYDGPNTNGTLVGVFTGNTLPLGGTIESLTGAFTIVQESDVYLNYQGFQLSWQCSYAAMAPSCNFKTERTLSCDGDFQFQDLSLHGPTGWLWDFGDGQTSNLQHPMHTYSGEGVYSVKLKTQNAFGADSLLKINYVEVFFTGTLAGQGAGNCGPGSVDLSVSGPGDIFWFNSEQSWDILDTGLVFSTPVLAQSTTFWASSVLLAPEYAGKPDNSGGGGYFTNTNVHYQVFDVFSPVVITSVKVYAQSAGTRVISLRDANEEVLQSRTVNIPAGESRVILNFAVEAGSDYQLAGPGNPNLYRNNAGCAYPYSIDGLISIKSSSAGSGVAQNYYYFFYDWEVRDQSCFGERTEVSALIDQEPVSGFSFVENYQTLTFNNQSLYASQYLWDFGDGESSTDISPVHVYDQTGNYTIQLVAINSCGADTLNQSVSVIFNQIGEYDSSPEIQLFPNPTSGAAWLSFPSINSPVSLDLFDVSGKRVREFSFSAPFPNQPLEISLLGLESGFYFLKGVAGSLVFSRQICLFR